MTAIYSSYMLTFVSSFIRIERGEDGGSLLHTKQDASFCSKISEYQCFAVCCPKTSSCASKPSQLLCKLVIRQFLFQVSLGLKEVQMGPMTSNLTWFLSLLENQEISMFRGFEVCCTETSSSASKPFYCDVN